MSGLIRDEGNAMSITFGSVCSGIEAASAAWHPLGWSTAWLAEVDAFPSAVLAHHFPGVENHGDMTTLAAKVLAKEIDAPDVLVGGTPCQSFSVAGMRKGLCDPRGQLTLSYVELLNAIDDVRLKSGSRPAIAVWENVPGVLNDKGNAFGNFLASLAGENEQLEPPREKWANAGYVLGAQRTIAWRVLDAQFFGVAQRRRRVFVVATARKDTCPTEILFEWDGLRGDIAPSGEAGQEATREAGAGIKDSGEAIALAGNTISRQPHARGNGTGYDDSGACYTLTTTDRHAVATFDRQSSGEYGTALVASTIAARDYKSASDLVLTNSVRRLTPVECERLQGFPDSWTQIEWRGKPVDECPDGHRYKALGNSMAVPVMQWIGKRIARQLID